MLNVYLSMPYDTVNFPGGANAAILPSSADVKASS